MKPSHESIYVIPGKLLAVADALTERQLSFVQQMQALIDRKGEAAHFTVRQVKWIRILHARFCVAPQAETQTDKPLSKLDERRAKRDKILKRAYKAEKLQRKVDVCLATSAPLLATIHADTTTAKMMHKRSRGMQLMRNKALIKQTRYDEAR